MGLVRRLSGKFETAEFYTSGQTFVDGKVGDPAFSLAGSAPVKFYVSSSSETVVQDKFKTELIGVVLLDPEDMTFEIPEGAKIVIGANEYEAIHAEDVALQSKVIQIPVKRFGK